MPLAPTFGYLIWDKQIDGLNSGEVEYCWTTERFAPRIFRYRAVGVDGGKLHPTQKPIALMRWCIQKAKVRAGGIVLDPFAGSGTTAIAAILEGRRCILIEKDARYVEIARQRVAKALCRDAGNLFRETEQAGLFGDAA